MTSAFLNFHISTLKVLSDELTENRRSIQHLSGNIKTLTTDAQERLKLFFAEMISKQQLYKEDVEQNAQIKTIYSLIRQINRKDAEKRAFTRQACDILDKYLEAFNQKLRTASTYHNFTDDDHRCGLLKTMLNIKFGINQPLQGGAVIVDLIKKLENKRNDNSEDSIATNIESAGQRGDCLKFGDGIDFHLTDQIDNLQEFTDKIFDICSEMRNRHQLGNNTNSHSDLDILTVSEERISSTTEESTEDDDADDDADANAELCHCRKEASGPMVACDNAKCTIGWYHFECVALHKAPEGSWFCPSCVIFENE